MSEPTIYEKAYWHAADGLKAAKDWPGPRLSHLSREHFDKKGGNAGMEQIQVIMTIDRSTKYKHLYRTDDDESPVENIYVLRQDMPVPPPKTIIVTVTEKS